MIKKTIPIIVLAMTLALSAPTAAFADLWSQAESDQYGAKAGGMLGRGLINAASCFVDIIVQTVDKTQSGPPVVGTLAGIGSGAACTILRAGSGVVDVATFWVPGFNGVPVSRDYHDCILQSISSSAGTSYTSQASVPSSSYAEAPQVTTRTQAAPATTGAHDPMKYVKK